MTEPIEPRPAPVVDIAGQLGGIAAGAFSAVAVLVMTVVSDGIHPDNLGTVTNYVSLAVAAVAGLVGWIVQRIHARKAADQVTPLSDPRDHRMRPLKVDPDFYGKHAAAESSYDWYDRGGYVPGGPVPVVNTGKPEPVFTAEQVRAATGDRLDGWPGVLNDDTEEIPRVTDQPVRRIPEHVVPGHRLGRHVRHDPRSLSYLVPETTTPTTAMWTRRVPVFDQGDLGSCTGNAAAGVLGTDPFYATLPTGLVDDEGEAVKLYSAATSLDDYPGTYPPDDTGSDGLSVAKACKAAGLISGYQHITSVAAAQTAIKSGPFIVGCEWWTSMDNPDADGLVTVHGTVRGGHEFVCDGYDVQADEWHFTNSWGSGWGKDGHFKMSSASFAKLLAAQGDATVFLPAAAPFPPSPQPPAPTPPNPPAPVLPPASVAALMARILHRKGSPKEDVAAAKDYDTWLAAQ